jgi:hypothetical protein
MLYVPIPCHVLATACSFICGASYRATGTKQCYSREPLKGRETRTAHKRTKCDRADVSEQASFPHYAKEVEAELSSPSTD